LQIVEQLLIDVAEVLALGQVVEVDAADPVDHLPHELAGLHVVVGVFEHAPHHAAAAGIGAGDGQFLERGKQFGVNEVEKRVTGDPFWIGGPGAPLQLFREGRAVVILHHFELLVLIVDDFQKEHPTQLGEALGIAIDPDVLAHDVLDGFDGVSDGHGLGTLLVKGGLQYVNGVFKASTGTERLDELDRCAHRVERRDF
jgi:hypothetical protein